jgi:hypothetical protein
MVYAMVGMPLDMLAEAANQAVKARFPELAPEDALPFIGRDRGIRRGPNEPAVSFRTRLLLWREIWKGAGNAVKLLDELAGYLTPQKARMRIWSQVGLVYTRDVDGTFTIDRVPGLWNWDGLTTLRSRFWVIIYSVGGEPWSRDGTWGDGEKWGESGRGTWGSTATLDQVQTIRAIIGDRKPAPTVCKGIIVSFDAGAFAPTDTSPPLPDGTWGRASRNIAGKQTHTRDRRAIYWQGVT